MREQFPGSEKAEEEPRDTMTTVIEGQELGGISAALEKIYNQESMIEVLKKPEFGEVRELVEDFQEIVHHEDGSKMPVSEAVKVLRIIAKKQTWNEDFWSWDVIRTEAEKMGYIVRDSQTGSGYSERKAA
ncbi:MAG: hypothetical protein U1A25_02705 [Candidatus Sungbacteria bacterium]|nr:hypothetical protein [bacterium]MDZ4260552.1 hypothetical protein [Candidatus Sungbacteria bacterium]